LSFPAPTALAATMLPKYFLQTRGLDLAGCDIHYVGSQESAIMNVYLGKTVAAGTWPLPWELLLKARPELGKALEIKWMTPPLVNNGLVARADVPAEHVAQVLRLLLDLPKHERGREILREIHISCFEPATAATFVPVRNFLVDYYRLFPAEQGIPEG
jgi:phosphonate transport system substrate-binding protein